MSYNNLEPVSKQVTIVVGLTVVGFMAFGLALSYYRNVLFEQTLLDIKAQNDAIRGNISERYRDLAYYQSAQYKDKYAKENLGVVKPGEKVLILTHTPNPIEVLDQKGIQEERKEAAYLEILQQMPVLEHWNLYLFQPERIEELKRGL